MAPENGWCGHRGKRGGVCGEPITRGILNPHRWHHNTRMFNFSNVRDPDRHEPTPMTDQAEINTARRKWRDPLVRR